MSSPVLLRFRIAVFAVLLASPAAAQSDPLPSWNEDPSKQAIVEFVARVTKESMADYVPPPARIVTFDNDGTLWAEQPSNI